jgi:phosphopantothenoylcysteine decarboxylase/phosphopantothenate--cysteine ligase
MQTLAARRILLVVGGGIAAYKALELVRRLRERGASVRAIMTKAAHHFITPLSLSAITGEKVLGDLFEPDDEHDVGHIRLSREADLIVVAPATADLLAKMAHGFADDLATAVLLATDKPVLVAPAMNPLMWTHPATVRNLTQLQADGVGFVGPESGEMAERGEAGVGRLADPMTILSTVEAYFASATAAPATAPAGPLSGLRALVTSGPTREPIDPVRYIANRSSGRQGHAIAAALAAAGADVTLVSGPVEIPPPAGVRTVLVETARQLQDAVAAALPVDVAVLAAAVADWRVAADASEKIKKDGAGAQALALALVENPDILAGLARSDQRPALLIGFAAETENLLDNARAKLARKGCDWIVANDVSPETGIMGGSHNRVHLVTASGVEDWPEMSKDEVAQALVERIAAIFHANAPRLADSAEPAVQGEPKPLDGSLDIRPIR